MIVTVPGHCFLLLFTYYIRHDVFPSNYGANFGRAEIFDVYIFYIDVAIGRQLTGVPHI